MIFAGLELMGEIPFRDVIIYSTVLAADGRRMSKSLGTGIDPMEFIAEHGADATRYGVLKMSSAQDVRFSVGAIEEGRRLANKLWNVSRLILTNSEGAKPKLRPRDLEEHWIAARLEAVRGEVEEELGGFQFARVARSLYRLTFDDFCDWYAEAIKPRLYARDAEAQATALATLERLLKLLHPAMPHVTEEIWSNLPGRETRLIVAPWPEPLAVDVDPGPIESAQLAARIYRRSRVRIKLSGDAARLFETVVRPSEDHGDADAEIERVRAEIARAERMLGDERFVGNAPVDVVEGERTKLEQYRAELDALGG
jgi:valyl-tRNA synthetase